MMGSIKDLGPPAGDGMTVAFRPDGTPIFDFVFEGNRIRKFLFHIRRDYYFLLFFHRFLFGAIHTGVALGFLLVVVLVFFLVVLFGVLVLS
jgi:hypothetical protein